MEIRPITPVAQSATDSAAATSSDETSSALGDVTSDFETFLTLLTSQLENQDPLNPSDSTEWVAQLAQFSGVEQQVRSNDRLDRIIEMISGGSADGLATWIGTEVRAPVSAVFDGEPIEIEVTALPEADRSIFRVRNDFGDVMAERAVDAESGLLTWDGTDSLGNTLPSGRYTFEMESYSGDDSVGVVPGKVFATVTEVRLAESGAQLVVESGEQIAADSVTALR